MSDPAPVLAASQQHDRLVRMIEQCAVLKATGRLCEGCQIELKRLVVTPPLASPWQPIETAPKDGMYVLVYGTGITGIASWWERDRVWHEVGVGSILKPIAWMPLPAPPGAARGPQPEEKNNEDTKT